MTCVSFGGGRIGRNAVNRTRKMFGQCHVSTLTLRRRSVGRVPPHRVRRKLRRTAGGYRSRECFETSASYTRGGCEETVKELPPITVPGGKKQTNEKPNEIVRVSSELDTMPVLIFFFLLHPSSDYNILTIQPAWLNK